MVRRNLGLMASFWAVGKLMANGRLYLRMVAERGPTHVWRDRVIWDAVREGNRRLTS